MTCLETSPTAITATARCGIRLDLLALKIDLNLLNFTVPDTLGAYSSILAMMSLSRWPAVVSFRSSSSHHEVAGEAYHQG